MREIKFRGQRVDNGEWVYGMPLYGNLDTNITEMQCYINNRHYIIEIKPESIGQYTGLKDKNGVEIYEGDKLCYNDCGEPIKVVEYSLKNGNYIMRFEKGGGFVDTLPYFTERNCWVTGNIHEK